MDSIAVISFIYIVFERVFICISIVTYVSIRLLLVV